MKILTIVALLLSNGIQNNDIDTLFTILYTSEGRKETALIDISATKNTEVGKELQYISDTYNLEYITVEGLNEIVAPDQEIKKENITDYEQVIADYNIKYRIDITETEQHTTLSLISNYTNKPLYNRIITNYTVEYLTEKIEQQKKKTLHIDKIMQNIPCKLPFTELYKTLGKQDKIGPHRMAYYWNDYKVMVYENVIISVKHPDGHYLMSCGSSYSIN